MRYELLRMDHVGKMVESVYRMHNINLNLLEGEVLVVLGLSGSERGTLMGILSGRESIDSGVVYFNDVVEQPRKTLRRNPLVFCIHHETMLLPHFSIAENIYLKNNVGSFMGFLKKDEQVKRTKELFARYGLDIEPSDAVGEYVREQYYIIELLKAVSEGAKIIIMDSVLDKCSLDGWQILSRVIRKMCTQGIGFIILSNHSRELLHFADRIALFHKGTIVKIMESGGNALISYLRWDSGNETDGRPFAVSEQVALNIRGLSSKDLMDISIDFRKGGITGILDTQRTGIYALWQVLTGRQSYIGEILLEDKSLCIKNIQYAMKHGIGFMPANCMNTDLFTNLSFIENILCSSRLKLGAMFFWKKASFKYLQKYYGESFGINRNLWHAPVSDLDIYTRQKIYLARWNFVDLKVLFCDSPFENTNRITKNILVDFFAALTSRGVAVVIFSMSSDELAELCDVVFTLSKGRLDGGHSQQDFILLTGTGREIPK